MESFENIKQLHASEYFKQIAYYVSVVQKKCKLFYYKPVILHNYNHDMIIITSDCHVQ